MAFNSDKVKRASRLLKGWDSHKLLTVGLAVHIKSRPKASAALVLTAYVYGATAGSFELDLFSQ